MKWFIGTLLVLNMLTALYGALKQKPETDIHAQDVNAAQLKLLPADWKPPQASAPLASAPLPDVASSAPQAQAPQVASATAAVPPPVKEEKAPAKAADSVKVDVKPASAVLAKTAPESKLPEAKLVDTKAAAANLCYSWGGLDPKQLERVQGGVPLLKLATPPQASVVDEKRGSGKAWVFYPPLKGKGFDSYIVQTAGEYKGYLSMGLFSREEGAQALVKRLKAAGYDKAKVDSRGDVVKVTTLTFRQLDDATAEKLKALQKRLLPGKPLASCR